MDVQADMVEPTTQPSPTFSMPAFCWLSQSAAAWMARLDKRPPSLLLSTLLLQRIGESFAEQQVGTEIDVLVVGPAPCLLFLPLWEDGRRNGLP